MDRISDLPDHLRNRIVSLLWFEDAVRTSILSRKWRKVCSSLKHLDFHQQIFESTHGKFEFKDFVYQTLLRRDGLSIDTLNLCVDLGNLSSTHVNSWISFALSRNLKELNLSVFSWGEIEKLPCCLFTCTTLVMLKLKYISIELPSIIEFPMLKILKLTGVTLPNENSMNRLFSSCPLLEKLYVRDCLMEFHSTLKISGSNIVFLEFVPLNPNIDVKISANNLREIDYWGCPPDISSETLSSLLSVNFGLISGFATQDVFYDRASNIVMGLHNVTKMILRGYIKLLYRGRDSLPRLPRYCSSLQRLMLNMYPEKCLVPVIILLLSAYPNLKHFEVAVPEHASAHTLNMDGYSQALDLSTEKSLKNLKIVDYDYFEGSESELDLLKYLLENANAMEKMNILYTHKMTDVSGINERIMAFKRASADVVISIAISVYSEFAG